MRVTNMGITAVEGKDNDLTMRYSKQEINLFLSDPSKANSCPYLYFHAE